MNQHIAAAGQGGLNEFNGGFKEHPDVSIGAVQHRQSQVAEGFVFFKEIGNVGGGVDDVANVVELEFSKVCSILFVPYIHTGAHLAGGIALHPVAGGPRDSPGNSKNMQRSRGNG